MKKIKIIIIFIALSLLLAAYVYFTDKRFNIIIDGNTIYHYDEKFTRINNIDSLSRKTFHGLVDNKRYTNIKVEKKDDIYYLNSSEDLDYSNSFLYDKNVDINLLNYDKTEFNDDDYNLLYEVLNDYNLTKNDVIGDEYKYEIDLNDDGLMEYIYFSSNYSLYDIPTHSYTLVYLVANDNYTIIRFNNKNKFEGRIESLNKVFRFNNKIYFTIELVGYSDENECNMLYSFDNKLNGLITDC